MTTVSSPPGTPTLVHHFATDISAGYVPPLPPIYATLKQLEALARSEVERLVGEVDAASEAAEVAHNELLAAQVRLVHIHRCTDELRASPRIWYTLLSRARTAVATAGDTAPLMILVFVLRTAVECGRELAPWILVPSTCERL